MMGQLEQEIMATLFQRFNKGYKGEFGLGLAVVSVLLLCIIPKYGKQTKRKVVLFFTLGKPCFF